MILYLTYWFPRCHLARLTANFGVAIPLSFVVGGPLSSPILGMDGMAGLHGWQWLFLMEGLPAFLLSFAALKLLPNGPADASWLTGEEKNMIAVRLAAEDSPGRHDLWWALRDPRVLTLGLASFAYQASRFCIVLWLPQIVQAMGFSNFANGFVMVLPFAAAAGAMIAGGRSRSRRGERIRHVALPWLLAASAFAVMSIVQSTSMMLAALTFGLPAYYAAYGAFNSLAPSFLRGTTAALGLVLAALIGLALGRAMAPRAAMLRQEM
jgi:MFS transporter, ACS family, tartrate transporter